MKSTGKKSEQGQILVLIVLALVGLLGFAALAIDLGMIYSDRRIDQNIADSTAYAGAAAIGPAVAALPIDSFQCTDGTFTTPNPNLALKSANKRAEDNGFIINTDNAVDDGLDNEIWLTCTATNINVHTRITKQVSTSLMHLFYHGAAINQVESVVTLTPRISIAPGVSILALRNTSDCGNPDTCLTIDGNSEVRVIGGSVISNSDFTKSGHSGIIEVVDDDGNPLTGGLQYLDEFIYNGSLTPGEQVSPYPPEKIDTPVQINLDFTDELRQKCAQYSAYSMDSDYNSHTHTYTGDVTVTGGSTRTLYPGKYRDIAATSNNAKILFMPGLYCINSLNISSSGGPSGYAITANLVTFFMDEGAGNFTIGGNARSTMSAPTETCIDDHTCNSGTHTTSNTSLQPAPDPIQGVLLWSAVHSDTGSIKIIGSVDSAFEGSMIAQYTEIELGGNVNQPGNPDPALTYNLQLVGYDVSVHGNVLINVHYDVDRTPHTDSELSLWK